MSVPISSWLGNYQVIRMLGAGGMGEVYLVREPIRGAEWALKTLVSATPGSELWERFVNEGRVLSQLNHPNIAAFREMFQVDTRPCLVMEYVDGETLFDRVHRRGRLLAEEALPILRDIVEALGYLHDRNVLHRDLKSANIKISTSGQVKLLDFGIAKQRRAPGLTAVGAVMGTPEYLSPEQVLGQPADIRSEIWMAGLLGYEMLTGSLPFQADNELSLFHKIRNEDLAPPSAIQPGVPAAVDKLVLKCLDKNPARRFQSPKDLVDAIQKSAPSKPRPASKPLVAWTEMLPAVPAATKRLAAMAAAALLLIFLLAQLFSRFEGGGGDMRTIVVDVAEGKADVYENGRNVGRTPYRVHAKIGDSVQLELRKTGFADQAVQFDVTERNAYSYTMQPIR